MKKLVFLAFFLATGSSALPQGTVHFNNYNIGWGIDAPVLNADGTPLDDGFAGQLYAGTPGGPLNPVGSPVRFKNNPTTGMGTGYIVSGKVVIPGVAAPNQACLQLRAWDTKKGATYEGAKLAGGRYGESAVIKIFTGGDDLYLPVPPSALTGLQGFKLVGLPPLITQQPQDLSVPEGAPATFQVVAAGDPVLQYQWSKDGNNLPGQTSDTLSLPAAQVSDVGVYRVQVSNPVGSVTSEPALLLVYSSNCLNYEDLPGGMQYFEQGIFDCGGVTHTVGAYPGTPGADARVTVENQGLGQYLSVRSAMVYFRCPELLACLSLGFADRGGGVNLVVGSQSVAAAQMADLNQTPLKGVSVWVRGGRLYLLGLMEEVGIGGHELELDDVCVGRLPPVGPTCVEFERLAPSQATYFFGDKFLDADSQVRLAVEAYQRVPGTYLMTGSVAVGSGGQAGGSGQEMLTSAACLGFKFGQTWPGVTLLFGQAAGPINLRVGTETVVESDIGLLNNAIVGGVPVSVVVNPQTGRGVLTLQGSVETFGVGGESLYVDHVCPSAGPGLKGDVTADGKVDNSDVGPAQAIALKLSQPGPELLSAADTSLDGRVTVLDAVLIDRAAEGLAPLPTNAVSYYPNRPASVLRIGTPPGPVGPDTFEVPVELVSAVGGELGVAFTLSWDPDLLDFQWDKVADIPVPLPHPAALNTTEVAHGRLGYSLVLPGGTNSLPPGTYRLLTVTFQAVPSAVVGTSTRIGFGNDLAVSEMVALTPEKEARPVPVRYEPGLIAIGQENAPGAKPALADNFVPKIENPGAMSVNTLAVQPDGKVLVGGFFSKLCGQPRSNFGRLNADGTLDQSFDPGPNNAVYSLVAQTDGKILVGGPFTKLLTLGGPAYLGRLNADGTLDGGFDAKAGGYPEALATQADGKILMGGLFHMLGGESRESIGRLNADGTADLGFNPGAAGYVFALAVQPDGKILVGGYYSSLGGQPRSNLGRVNADGTLDVGFNPGTDAHVFALAVQADGKILVGGKFTTLGGQPRNYLGRLNADGTVDSTFTTGAGGTYMEIHSLAVQADGKILVGGRFTTLGTESRNNIGRLNADGTVDTGFDPGANATVFVLTVEPRGKILAGGIFTTLGGQLRICLGRLDNTGPAREAFRLHGAKITWLRGGAGPEVWRATLDYSTDKVTWTSLGPGTRVPGGWEWVQPERSPLPKNTVLLRSRGFVPGVGLTDWYVERSYRLPAVFTDNISFGMGVKGFGFLVSGVAGQEVAVQASPDLGDWTSVGTNVITSNAWFYFSDGDWRGQPRRFYRAVTIGPP